MGARVGDWIQTYTGVHFYPLDPRPEDFRIEDIAHALSNLCRYTGHVSRFYSVAEHSVHVSRLCPPGWELAGLLHDAAEAYINDLSRPLKHGGGLDGYRAIEWGLDSAIAERFTLGFPLPMCVKDIDKAMFWWESRELMMADRAWEQWREYADRYDRPTIYGWSPDQAKIEFLMRFKELVGADHPFHGAISKQEEPAKAVG